MSLPNRIAAYDDCFEIFDKAIATGARVGFKIYSDAKLFIMRLHQARYLLREESQRLYSPSDPRWGKTDYDRLIVRHPVEDTEGNWWVYIEHHGSNILAVEALEPPATVPQLEASKTLNLKGPNHETSDLS